MARDDPHFRLRVPEDLKRRIEEQAHANGRSLNAEIVVRLKNSFRSDATIADLKTQLALLDSLEPTSVDQVSFRLTPKLVEMLEASAREKDRTIGSEIRDLLRESLESSEAHQYEVDTLKRTIEHQKTEIDRLRNQRFGGRAITAELDALQREKNALEATRSSILENDRTRNEKIDSLIAAFGPLASGSLALERDVLSLLVQIKSELARDEHAEPAELTSTLGNQLGEAITARTKLAMRLVVEALKKAGFLNTQGEILDNVNEAEHLFKRLGKS